MNHSVAIHFRAPNPWAIIPRDSFRLIPFRGPRLPPALLRPTIFFAALKGYAPPPRSPPTLNSIFARFSSPQTRIRHAGLLNPVDATHHMRMEERSRFREGVVLRPKSRQKRELKDTLDHECSMSTSGCAIPFALTAAVAQHSPHGD